MNSSSQTQRAVVCWLLKLKHWQSQTQTAELDFWVTDYKNLRTEWWFQKNTKLNVIIIWDQPSKQTIRDTNLQVGTYSSTELLKRDEEDAVQPGACAENEFRCTKHTVSGAGAYGLAADIWIKLHLRVSGAYAAWLKTGSDYQKV